MVRYFVVHVFVSQLAGLLARRRPCYCFRLIDEDECPNDDKIVRMSECPRPGMEREYSRFGIGSLCIANGECGTSLRISNCKTDKYSWIPAVYKAVLPSESDTCRLPTPSTSLTPKPSFSFPPSPEPSNVPFLGPTTGSINKKNSSKSRNFVHIFIGGSVLLLTLGVLATWIAVCCGWCGCCDCCEKTCPRSYELLIGKWQRKWAKCDGLFERLLRDPRREANEAASMVRRILKFKRWLRGPQHEEKEDISMSPRLKENEGLSMVRRILKRRLRGPQREENEGISMLRRHDSVGDEKKEEKREEINPGASLVPL